MKVLSIVLVLVISALAIADSTVDDALAQAEALAKRGDYVGAAGQFKLAYARDPRPELICNVGVAYYKAKQLPRAQLFLNRCLERGTALDAKFVDSVRAVLKSVESALRTGEYTPVDIVVEPAGATVTIAAFGDDEAFIGSRVVWLARGKQALRARAEGYVEQTLDVDPQGREIKPVKITLQRTPVEPPPTGSAAGSATGNASDGSAAGSAATGSATVAVPVEPERIPLRYDRPSKVPAIVATSVGVAAIVLAVVSYQRAHDRAELAGFALSAEAYEADKSSVSTWNTVMVTGAAIGIASAGIAGFLWSRALRSPPIEMQATGSSIAISGRF